MLISKGLTSASIATARCRHVPLVDLALRHEALIPGKLPEAPGATHEDGGRAGLRK